jgi:glycosyltransferase involved in cell wall biosynthesis
MTICIDARMLNNSGIGVYIKNYIKFILYTQKYNLILLGNRKEIQDYFVGEDRFKIIEFNAPIYSIKEQLQLPLIIPKCDIFWSPHYNIPVMPIRAKKRLVTIPDAAHLALSKVFEFSLIKRYYAKIVFKAAAYLSDHITTISYFSKEEIIKYTKVKAEKISVIHLGIDNTLFRKIDNNQDKTILKNKYNLPDKYILFVGNVKPHKNLKGLILAFKHAENKLKDYKILIVGKKEGFITGDKEVFSLIEKSELIDKITFTGYVSTEDLPLIYNFADIFVFPSIYEGFGFPPLEAMACGCPVVTTKKASMPEICEDAVKYVEIENTESLSSSIIEVAENESLRNSLINKGYVQYKKFTWEASGKEFTNILEAV